jgi:acetylornithine deacetylase
MSPLAQFAVSILERLVAFDTVSRNSNLVLVDWLNEHLRNQGIVPTILPSSDGTKANMFVTVGPPERPGLVLSGHTDVVPVDGQSWQHEPFRLTKDGDKLFGRGTADMKGYVACIIALLPLLRAAPLRRPIHLSIWYDEEVGCLGVPFIIEHMRQTGLRAEAAFIGEPSRMQVVNGHKGSCGMLTEVVGLSCHSSRVDIGVSAIFHAADIIAELRRQAEKLAAAPDSIGIFDPPYSTVGVGVVRGGTVRNAIAGDCRIEWDIRATRPGIVENLQTDVQAYIDRDVVPAMRVRYLKSDVTTRMVYDVPPLQPLRSEAEALGWRLAATKGSSTVAYGSEAGYFQRAGIPTVIVGPGDIAQAHTADEWIALDEIEACCRFMERLATFAQTD